MREIDRDRYARLYGPTEGDRLKLADTELITEVETDHTTRGDETVFGGGKTLRDGMGMTSGLTSAEGTLDWVLTNVTVIDPVLVIEKGDLGIKEGRIVGLGSAGNPETMDGVSENLVVGTGTDAIPGEGLIATPGALDIHVHFNTPQLADHAIASGITTMLGGGFGGGATTTTPGPRNIELLLRAAD